MIVVPITTHVQDSLNRFLQQYKGKQFINGFMTALVNQVQDLENAIYPLDSQRQIFNAVGEQLDGIGEIVGIKRNGLSDALYLLFLYGKIGENFSDSTIPALLTIIQNLFRAQTLIFSEVYPAGISVQVLGTGLDPSLYSLAIGLVQNSVGAGIKLTFAGGSPTTNVFRFDGPGIVGSLNGFGSTTDPTIGGVFVGIIS